MSLPDYSPSIPRRSFLRSAAIITGGLLVSRASKCDAAKTISEAELASILAPVLNLRDSLAYLKKDIEEGTNADVRRVVKTLQKGIDLNRAIRDSSSTLNPTDREQARVYGREAMEYMNQIVEYYDPTSKGRPLPEVLNFAVKAVDQARIQLDNFLQLYPTTVVEASKNLLTATNGES